MPGKLPKLDESEEINACTVKITVEADVKPGLAAAFQERDPQPSHGNRTLRRGGHLHRRRYPGPLSGRSYVYGAMRVTGAADPLVPVSETISRQVAPAEAGDHGSRWIFLLR